MATQLSRGLFDYGSNMSDVLLTVFVIQMHRIIDRWTVVFATCSAPVMVVRVVGRSRVSANFHHLRDVHLDGPFYSFLSKKAHADL